jgi:hypothetical protein
MKTSRKYSQCQMNSQNEVNRRMHGERPSDCRRRFRGKNPRSRTIRRRTQGRGTTGRSSEDMVPTVAAWVLMCNGVRCTWVYVDTHTRSARWQPKGLAHQYSCVCVSTVVMWDLLGPTSVSSMCVNTAMIPPPWGPRMSTSIMWTPRGPASVPVRRSFAMHSPVCLILAVHLAPCLFE